MKVKIVSAAICSALGGISFVQPVYADTYWQPGTSPSEKALTDPTLRSVSFIGMPPPATAVEKAAVYTKAKIIYTYKDNSTKTYNLNYQMLMATNDLVNGSKVGGLYDFYEWPLTDSAGQLASDAPDGSSLMLIPGMSSANPSLTNALALVTQYEYRGLPPVGMTGDFWSKLPALMSLSQVYQQKTNGKLEIVNYEPIVFSDVNGGWIHCGSTLSDWNTHLGSEEYEPDAKLREGLPVASDADETTDINSFSKYYFGNTTTANPYNYGLVPEVDVYHNGVATVVKHRAPGRLAREMLEIASDGRTTISGDDGKNTGLFMFVADYWGDLSAGTLYAAKVTQTSAVNGGSYNLKWIKLGHASDAEIEALVAGGIKFSNIFDVSLTAVAGYTKVITYTGTEWLRLKTGMAKAAAFLETRRYAALLGATTEFSKMEYIAYNKPARKFYITISRVEAGMADTVGDIKVARNDGGIILIMDTAAQGLDTSNAPINSRFIGTSLVSIPELVGGWSSTADAEGNKCRQDKICGPDNLRFVASINTLFIGEDTTRRNNNYVWAFNLGTRALSRILSVPMEAEATGLMVATNYNGYAYIMSNFQHPGADGLANYLGADKQTIVNLINANWGQHKRAAIGYIGTMSGALPAF